MSASPRVARSRSKAQERSTRPTTSTRDRLQVTTSSKTGTSTFASRVRGLVGGVHPRRMRLFHFVCALVFLGASLIGSLVLRTQMIEDSFAITDTQQSIGRLTQDIQEKQTELDALEASLPSKAQKLGMVPGSDALTIDLSGYAASNDAKGSK